MRPDKRRRLRYPLEEPDGVYLSTPMSTSAQTYSLALAGLERA